MALRLGTACALSPSLVFRFDRGVIKIKVEQQRPDGGFGGSRRISIFAGPVGFFMAVPLYMQKRHACRTNLSASAVSHQLVIEPCLTAIGFTDRKSPLALRGRWPLAKACVSMGAE